MGQTLTKRLGELFAALDVACSPEVLALEVCGVTDDSRKVVPGMLFVAVCGDTVDGHRFIEAAEAGGCAAVLANRGYAGACGVPLITVRDTAVALGLVAAAFYDFPCRRMKMIGITGTNGKTTCTYLLEGLVRAAGGSPGVIGTVSVRYAGHEVLAAMTTPQPVELQEMLRRMADAGVTHVAMEVSSHALARQRVNGIAFDVALFTNITRDHLDYHGSMERYFAEKQKLFTRHLKKEGKAVVVLDQERQDEGGSEWCRRLIRELAAADQPLLTCGIGCGMIQARNFHFDLTGIRAEIVAPAGQCSLKSPLAGAFNLKNLLAAIGCGLTLGYELPAICRGLTGVTGAPGRLERVVPDAFPGGRAAATGATVFVDYAHTPDALENVLLTLRQLSPARLVVVFGCGGDRDRGKRPLMGQVAARLADVLLVTSDNPRSESPRAIMAEIEQGIVGEKLPQVPAEQLLRAAGQGYDLIEERAQAIRIAIHGAKAGDVVLISGKGHECYQIIGGRKLFFDDRQQAKEQLNMVRQAA